MALSNELVSQFAKLLNDKKKSDSGTITYGKIIVKEDGQKYVRLDGSDVDTPITEEDNPAKASTTTNIQNDDRVSVLIKNHAVTVLGNVSSPSATGKDITELDIAIAKKIQAEEAYFKKLIADEAIIGELEAAKISVMELIASKAEIDKLIADEIRVTDLIAKKIDADLVVADSAIIDKLIADKISVLDLIADDATINELIAKKATINSLIADKLDATWANIDFADIDIAKIGELFAKSGIINDLKVGDASIAGELVGVTIKGDLIEAGTLKADRLVVKGSDGNYYALNTDFDAKPGVTPVEEDEIHGSVLVKKSIVAEKIDVKDLVAFGATIGGFHITDDSIYSGVKNSVDSPLPGTYQDSTGQFAVGDGNNFLRFYKQEDGSYKLDLSTAAVRDLEPLGRVSGEGMVRIDDVSSVKHEMKVQLNVDGSKNLYGGLAMANDMVESFGATIDTNVKTVVYTASGAHQKTIFDNFVPNTQYTIMMYGQNPLSDTATSTNIRVMYTDNTTSGVLQFENGSEDSYAVLITDATKSVKSIEGIWQTGSTILYYEKCGIFEGSLGVDEFEPYIDLGSANSIKVYGKNLYDNTTIADKSDASATGYVKYKIPLLNGTYTWSLQENNFLGAGAYVAFTDDAAYFGEAVASGCFRSWIGHHTLEHVCQLKETFAVTKGYVYLAVSGASMGTVTPLLETMQIEYGSTATEYMQYRQPSTCYANEDGSVDGVLSMFPTTTLVSNSQYVTIDCTYNKNNTLGDDRGNQSQLENRVIQNESSIANLTVGIDGINAEVQKNTKLIEDSNSDTNARLIEVEKKASVAMDADSVNIAITKVLSETGASRLKTSTGYVFDEEGMTVHKSDSEMSTQITDNGMTVSKNDNPVLTANNKGVDAVNLHASTYLTVGGRVRFEKYGTNRVGCFWI